MTVAILVSIYFNSIKVQLELTATSAKPADSEISFHKGTIRTRLQNAGFNPYLSFQFHKGTIRTPT